MSSHHSSTSVNLEEGMVLQFADGTIGACNDVAQKILGLTTEQLIGRNSTDPPWQAIHEDGSAFPGETHPAMVALQTGKAILDVVMGIYKPNGQLIWLLITSKPLFQGRNIPYAVITTFIDITESKVIQQEGILVEALLESQHLIQMIADATPAIFYLYDLPEERLLYINPQVVQILGYTQQEFQETGLQSLFKLIHPEDLVRLPSHLQNLEAGGDGEVRNFEFRYRHVNGDWRWLSSYETVITRNAEGKTQRILGICQDITQRRSTEIALKRSNERFELAAAAVNSLIYDWDVERGTVERTSGLTTLLGYSLAESLPSDEWWRSLIHPDDLDASQKRFKTQLLTSDRYSIEYRIKHKDGHYIWVQDNGLAAKVEGEVIRIVGSSSDITERKQTEALLKENTERMELATTGAEVGMWFWNILTNELVWTDKCKALFGLSQDTQISYELFLKCLHPEDRERTHEAVTQCLEANRDYDIEYRSVWDNGSIHWIAAKGRSFRDTEGKPIRMMGTAQDITSRKQVEESLVISQERLELAQKAGEIGSFDWDVQTGQVTWTQELETIFGFEEGSFGGRYENWQARVHPYDLPLIEQSLQETMQNYIEQWQAVYRMFRYDSGEMRWIDARGRFFYNSGQVVRMIGTNVDITERKQTEEALRQSELTYRTLADTMPQMFWITQPDGYHEYYNKRWYDYTGTTPEQAQGEGWKNLLHPDDVEKTQAIWSESLCTGKDYNIEYRFRRACDGQYRWHLGRAFPLRDEDGQIIKWFGSCTDIHDQKLAVEERVQMLERERNARQEAEKANRIKDEFLAVLSHELRSPLNPILGWAKLLKTRKFDEPTTAKAFDTIERNAKLQIQLIDDLLDVSRILRGKLSINFTTVDLTTVIDAAMETVKLAAETKKIQLKFVNLFTFSRPTVLGDPYRLQQVVGNLLSNAVKFTPNKGRVEVILQEDETTQFAQIIVTDTGMGISKEFLPHVFEYFRQADSSTTRQFGGLGLGLAIVSHMVELHKGTVAVDSLGEGKGATFTVSLGLANQQLEVANKSSENSDSQNLQGKRILIVDDSPDTREYIGILLEQFGATVTVASSAKEVLALIPESQPDLLISDLGMPEMDGYSLIQEIRAKPPEQLGNLPAIALTAYASEKDQEQVLAAGFQKHLAKPIEPDRLLAAIVDLLG
jgi:hypothetical protein